MSGNKKWAKKGIHVSKNALTYTGDTVKKDSTVRLDTIETVKAKIGLRLRKGQRVDRFEIKPAGSPTALTLTEISPANDPKQYADLNTVLPAGTEERWILYTTPFNKAFGKTLVTTLQLSPDPPNGGFKIHDNGFQVVTIVATADGVPLATGHYFFGVSLINGSTNTNEPYLADVAPAQASMVKSAKATVAKKTGRRKQRKKK
jgi:hypothetical protein